MLEHLKLGTRKNSRGAVMESNGTGGGQVGGCPGLDGDTDTVDYVKCSGASNGTNNNNNNHVNNITTTALAPMVVGKRNSISLNQAPGNTDSLKPRDLSPSPRAGQRKLSADLRNREDIEMSKPVQIRPVKLKNMVSRAETYDTLHLKTSEKVSLIYLFIF